MLRAAAVTEGLALTRLVYLDSIGMFVIARQPPQCRAAPARDLGRSPSGIAPSVPLSRRVDPLLMHSLGKSVVGVWRKAAPGTMSHQH